ncbi:MAG: lysophospholipid acyltransferase family protein [Firmicutes bacterium]|nr:lysophospholipid acyltransferase family protein [Bacillota bacterium]
MGTEKSSRTWTSRSLGSEFQHRIFYALISVAGRRGAYFALYFVVAWYVLLRPSVREKASFYLQRRFPSHRGWRRLWDTYCMSLELGKVLVDRAVLGILGPEKIHSVLTSEAQLRALLAEGKGLVLVMAHAGSWQLSMANLANLRASVSLLIHREPGDVDRHFFEHGRQTFAFRIIDPTGYMGGMLEMYQVLKAGEVLCIMGDRVMGGPGSHVGVNFLGGEIRVPISPYKLASSSGAPIAVIFPHKTGPDRFQVKLATVIRVPEHLGRRVEAFRPFAQAFSHALEEFVAEHPYQFFNFFDMWVESSDAAKNIHSSSHSGA